MIARWLACILGVALAGCAPRWGESPEWPAKLLGPTADGRAAIVGRIVDDVERPVAGALVILSCPCMDGQREISSGADGMYRFTGLTGGKYTIEVHQASIAKRMEVPAGAWFRVNFRIDSKK